MVSFSCEGCNETMIKKKVAQHLGRCRAPVTCIDCSKTFPGQSFKDHTQCMTEAEKYQGKLYKSKAAHPRTEPKKGEPKVVEKKLKEGQSKKSIVVKVSKDQSLKKVLKNLRKEHNLDKKKILESITVTKDGQLVFN